MATVRLIPDTRAKKDGSQMILLVIRIGKTRFVFSTGISTPSSEKFNEMSYLDKSVPQSKVKNVRLVSLKNKAEKLIIDDEARLSSLPSAKAKEIISEYVFDEKVVKKTRCFIDYLDEFVSIKSIIILAVGKPTWSYVFRFILAVLMSFLGAFIFDQIIFQNDLGIKVDENREKQIQKAISYRLEMYNTDIKMLTEAIDSIGRINVELYEKLQKNPVIKVTDVDNKEVVAGVDDEGNPIKTKTTNVVTRSMENPISAQTKANENQLAIYQEQLKKLQENKSVVDKEVRLDFAKRKVGFIEELNATWEVITSSFLSITFYCILFLVLVSLEIFVVTIKSGDTHCDYDLIVEHQLNIKKKTLEQTEDRLLNKKDK